MRVLKNRMFQVLMAVLTLTACSDTELVTKVQEGLPCTVQLTLAVPEQENVSMTRATDAQETTVEKVALFFYKKSQPDEAPVVVEITDMGTPTEETKTHYIYTVTVNTEGLYSGEWYLYAVANYDKQFVSTELTELEKLTKAQMDNFLTGGSGELDIVETTVLMSGKYSNGTDETLTLQAGMNTLENSTLTLRRLIAKNIFKFVDGEEVTFTPVSYSIYNYSTSSTLMERSGWGGVNGTDPGSVDGNLAAENSLKNKENIPITGTGFTFYTQENVQKSNTEIKSNYNLREKRNDDRSFMYAPANATYVVVKGLYKGPGLDDGTKVTGNVEYTIHLGDFSTSNATGDYNGNFTVRRNGRYTYTVTVKGVNNIIVEATTEMETDEKPFQHGAEGDIVQENSEVSVKLDAHYEQVLLSLDIPAGFEEFALVVNTPYTSKIYKAISELPENASEYDKSGDYVFDGADLNWVQFAKPATTTTFDAYTNVYTKMCGIKTLLKELNSKNESDLVHVLKGDDGKYYVAAYVNEYYYKGKDLSGFVNAANREMILASSVSTSADKHSTYTVTPIFSISQRSIKSPFNLDSDNPMGIETIEEGPMYRLNSQGEGDEGTTSTNESDRDKVKKTGESLDNGWENMTVTDNTYFCIVGKKWADFIDESNHGYIKGKLGQNGEGDDILKSAYQNPLYQMLTRNRDLDGDGVIDADELRWYVPARNQCMDLWMAYDALPTGAKLDTKNRLYFTSTAGVNRTWWADEGVSFGYWKIGDKTDDMSDELKGTNAVRVVRGLKEPYKTTSPIATYDDNKHIISMTGVSSLCLRSGKITGEYSAHLTGAVEDKLPKAFEFTTNSKTTTAEVAATGTVGSGEWRVPNERELGMIIMKNSGLFSDASYVFTRTRYTVTETKTRYYYYKVSKGFVSTSDEVTSTTSGSVFLVRDADESTSDSGSDSETSTTKTYDSSYSNNGVGFGVR